MDKENRVWAMCRKIGPSRMTSATTKMKLPPRASRVLKAM
jgi:hypothetical protein